MGLPPLVRRVAQLNTCDLDRLQPHQIEMAEQHDGTQSFFLFTDVRCDALSRNWSSCPCTIVFILVVVSPLVEDSCPLVEDSCQTLLLIAELTWEENGPNIELNGTVQFTVPQRRGGERG